MPTWIKAYINIYVCIYMHSYSVRLHKSERELYIGFIQALTWHLSFRHLVTLS